MRRTLQITTLVLLGVFLVGAQESSRGQVLAQLVEAESQMKKLSGEYLAPDRADIAEAQKKGLEVFRIMPRGLFGANENPLFIRGGGSYYSFVKKSHSYNDTPQIHLEQDRFSVGFYGGNYGLIADLGERPLDEIDSEDAVASFLLDYRPAEAVSAADGERSKLGRGLTVEALTYQLSVPAKVGRTYLLRSISYDEADTLVALTVARKDSDQSLVVFWKLLKSFEKPRFAKN